MNFLKISEELIRAKNALQDNSVFQTICCFGSARTKPDTPQYKEAEKLTKLLSSHFPKYSICSGGGLGMMEAINKGAKYDSLGLGIKLPFEQITNEYVNIEIIFDYFFTRKYWMLQKAEAIIAFEGGLGTLDEVFETLTLLQTGKMESIPVVLVGKEFWENAVNFDFLIEKEVISANDLELFKIFDTAEEAFNYLKEILI